MKTFKRLSPKYKAAIINEIKMMLVAHRDCLWNRYVSCSIQQAVDPAAVQLVATEGYYGEAFGVVRGLNALGYGYFGSDNLSAVMEGRSDTSDHNLKWWFQQILQETLDEEGYYNKTASPEKCKEMLDKYRLLVRK